MNKNYEEVPGWFSEEEASCLVEYIKQCSIIVELGSFCGRTSMLMSANKQEHCKLYCIDIWEPLHDYFVYHDNGSEVFKWKIDNVECLFDYYMKKLDYIKIHSQSDKVPETIKENTVDLLFIDTFHSANIVRQEFNAWKKYLKSGSIVAFHDYDKVNNYVTYNKQFRSQFQGYLKEIDSICSNHSLKKLELQGTLLVTQNEKHYNN